MRSLLAASLLVSPGAASWAVALHAQAAPSDGLVVGSVMTTDGLRRALLRLPEVREARTFYPFHYEGLFDAAWDVVVIEGWFEAMFAVIHEVRRRSPAVRVLYWCLDPEFPGLDAIRSIDVDGYLTNADPSMLAPVAPTQKLLLGFDPAAMRSNATRGERLVYVGSALGLATKRELLAMLLEARDFGLDLWGSGWGSVGPEELKPYWRGVLPHGDLALAYASAFAVLGSTMDGQRGQGMINNRVFEALGSGAALIQDKFPELEAELGEAANLFFYERPGDVAAAVRRLSERTRGDWEEARVSTSRVLAAHTYDARAATLLDFALSLSTSSATRRRGALRLALVYDSPQPQLFATLGPAAEALARDYSLAWIPADDPSADLLVYDVVAACGRLGGRADVRVRSLTTDYEVPRRLEQRRVLILLDVGDTPQTFVSPKSPASVYDAACAPTPSDARALVVDWGFRPASVEVDCYAAFGAAANVTDPFLGDVLVAADPGTPVSAVRAAAATADAVLVLGERVSASWLHELRAAVGVGLRLVHSAAEAAAIFGLARRIVVPHPPSSALPPPGQWAVAAGVRHSASVELFFADNVPLRNHSLDPGLGSSDYAAKIAFALTRALCLGRAAARAALVAAPSVGPNDDLRFSLTLDSFVVGRDGFWCLVEERRGTVACLLQHQLDLVLRLSGDCPASSLAFHAELKSNIFSDVLLASSTVTVAVDDVADRPPRRAAAYDQTQVLLWAWSPC